jgi:hypothetical protein
MAPKSRKNEIKKRYGQATPKNCRHHLSENVCQNPGASPKNFRHHLSENICQNPGAKRHRSENVSRNPGASRMPLAGRRLAVLGLPTSGCRLPRAGFVFGYRLPRAGFRAPAARFQYPASASRLPVSGLCWPASSVYFWCMVYG